MIRSFFEFLLSRSLDDGAPTTSWLHRRLRRDARLNRFDADARQLESLLRSSAAKRRQTMTGDDDTALLTLAPRRQPSAERTRDSSRSVRWLPGLAATAAVLLIVTPHWFQPATPAVHAGEFSKQLTVVPGEVLRLLTHAAKTSQTQLPQLSPLSDLGMPTLPVWEEVALSVESPVRQEIDTWQGYWQKLKSRAPSTARTL